MANTERTSFTPESPQPSRNWLRTAGKLASVGILVSSGYVLGAASDDSSAKFDLDQSCDEERTDVRPTDFHIVISDETETESQSRLESVGFQESVPAIIIDEDSITLR